MNVCLRASSSCRVLSHAWWRRRERLPIAAETWGPTIRQFMATSWAWTHRNWKDYKQKELFNGNFISYVAHPGDGCRCHATRRSTGRGSFCDVRTETCLYQRTAKCWREGN